MKPFFTVPPLLALLLPVLLFAPAPAAAGPRSDITVEGFKWGSGGPGRRAVFSEVTLRNSGRTDYSSVRLKARFYKRDGSAAGSVRGTVRGGLKAGEVKTFANVRLGVMNAAMDSVKLGVVGGRKAKDSAGAPPHPLVVSNVDWRGGGAGAGVGTVGSVTVKNPSSVPYGSVRFLVIQKSGGRALASTGVMTEKTAEAEAETVYKNINPGFVRPDTDAVEVRIVSAEPVSAKRGALMRGGETGEEADAPEPVPAYDIRVEKFEWGSGIAGSAGIIRHLVLRNASAVRYDEITMIAEFFSRSGTPVISNEFRIKNPPPPGETAQYRNLPVGILNYTPDRDRVKIRVRKGKVAPR
ncbi:MAG: hypothetical protein OXF42_02430 [Candidatus Dadabacteria bacterium]|nr:hypothetical protein [Candidatus Dadabacteria bacterium]